MLHTAYRLRALAASAVCAFAFGAGTVTVASAAAPADMDVKVQIVDDEIRTNVSFFVKAPQQRVWDVITDYERTPEYMRDVQVSKVLSRSGNTVRLMQKDQVRVGPFSMGIDTVRDVKHVAPVRTEAHLVSGSFKKYDSKMELTPEQGGTRVTYRSETVAGSALAGFATESMIRRTAEERFGQLRAEIQRRELVASQQ
jgi:carbon monoxide dehydrogenase subunit G